MSLCLTDLNRVIKFWARQQESGDMCDRALPPLPLVGGS